MIRNQLNFLVICTFIVGLAISVFFQNSTGNTVIIQAGAKVNNNQTKTSSFLSREELPSPDVFPKDLLNPSYHKDWTFMVYMSADNNLDQAGLDNLNKMAEVGSDQNVNIIALVDRQGSTKLYYIVKKSPASEAFSVPHIQNSPFSSDIDMGDPANLVTFVDWTTKHYPADHYALVLWGHGLGWRGVSFDGNNNNDALTPVKLYPALASITATNGFPLDIIGFDACMMQMAEFVSVISEFHLADYIVGSEESEPALGWNYEKVLSALEAEPSQKGNNLAETVTQTYMGQYPSDKVTMSAIQSSTLSNLCKEIDEFSVALSLSQEWTQISRARKQSEHFNEPSYIDLFDFSSHIRSDVSSTVVSMKASELQNSIINAAISNENNFTHPGAHGLSIYFPAKGKPDKSYLRNTVNMSAWYDFLSKYFQHQKNN